ncbi:uncharacterized protein [Gossypium hirsutum]|uniref:Retrotransposon gag domain-containing protein n=1 Tax=Gossypium hirsutum TaxID=3635 RepID=A0ABM2YN08_GOSHI|nr:uncharacterized protein LOC121205046 [Gossypium hirsutum]
MENTNYHCRINAKDLSLVPDSVLPSKFKTPEFEKYNGTSCPEAHITMFFWRMTRYVNNDQVLIHCFQDSQVGAASKWYNQLSWTKINSWKDLTQAFKKQYSHVMDMTLDRITLQNMEKKQNENFRQYAQRWREVAIQVQLPLLEKETTMLFINTLKAPFITHMLGSATKSFSDIVVTGEMIENAVRSGKIDAGESTKRSASRKRENRVNNVSTYNKGYSKPITMSQSKIVTTSHQGPPRQESNKRTSIENLQFTPIPITYRELYQSLFDAHVVSPFYLKPMQSPFPKWYDANSQCEYYAGITRHSIENCIVFKKLIERFINMGIVKFDDPLGPNMAGNSLPNHVDQWVNRINEYGSKRIKYNVAKVKTPLRWVWKEMVEMRLIILDLEERIEGMRNYCEFHNGEGHDIQECFKFKALVQDLMDNKEIEFYVQGPEKGDICTSEGESTVKVQKVNYPVVIISRPRRNKVGLQMAPNVIIQKPAVFPYKVSKRVLWNYDSNVTIPGEENMTGTLKEDQDVGFYTRSGKRYDSANAKVEPVKGKTFAVEQKKKKDS